MIGELHQVILFPDPQLVPRALHRLGDAFDDLRLAIATASEVKDVFPLLADLRGMAKEATALVDLAARRADDLLEER